MTSFSKFVKKIMDEKHLGVREIARSAGLDASFFSKILSGKRNPPSEEKIIKRLARAIGVDYVYLMFLAGRIPSEFQEMFLDKKFILSLYNTLESVNGKKFQEDKIAPRRSDSAAVSVHIEPLSRLANRKKAPSNVIMKTSQKNGVHPADEGIRATPDVQVGSDLSPAKNSDDEISEDLL